MPRIGIGVDIAARHGGGIDWSSYWITQTPSALLLTVLSDTSIKLDWTANGVEDYDGYSVERSTDGVTYAEVDTVLVGTETFTDTGLTVGTLYYYHVRAYKDTNYSEYCTAVSKYTYLYRDVFTTDRSAGAVHNSAIEPGTGVRLVGDTANKLSISLDHVLATHEGSQNPSIGFPAIARTAGNIFAARISGGGAIYFGLCTANNGKTYVMGYNIQGGGNMRSAAAPFQEFDAADNDLTTCAYTLFFVLTPTTAFYFIFGGKYAYPTLIYYLRNNSVETLYPGWAMYAASSSWLTEVNAIKNTTLPTALVSDTFNRADGAIGGVWTAVTGSAAVATNVAVVTPDTGVGIITTESGKADVYVIAKLTRSGGTVGIITHYIDADNYIRVVHDGTNLVIVQRLAGSESNLASAAVAYAAGTDIAIESNGLNLRAWYNDTKSGATVVAMNAALVGGTKVGLWSSDAGNTIDSFECYARGSSNEHASLGAIAITKPALIVDCDGDSLTFGGNPGTAYPTQLKVLYTDRVLEFNNLGFSGQTIAQMVANSPAKIDGHGLYCEKCVKIIWGGSNDLASSVAEATVYNNIVARCTAAGADGSLVIVLTILPRSVIAGGNETSRIAINGSIRNNYATFADAVADVAGSEFLDDDEDLTYFHTDNTHLTTAGYGVVAALVKAQLDTLI